MIPITTRLTELIKPPEDWDNWNYVIFPPMGMDDLALFSIHWKYEDGRCIRQEYKLELSLVNSVACEPKQKRRSA